MMIVGAQQPCFLPWVGYWHKMMSVDVLVEMASSQFVKGDYFNRVTLDGRWITLPVYHSLGQTIKETRVDPRAFKKISRTLQQSMAKLPYVDRLDFIFRSLEVMKSEWLYDFNVNMRMLVASTLGIGTRVVEAHHGEGKTTEERLLNTLLATVPNITEYYSGAAGPAYMKSKWPIPVKVQEVVNIYGGDSVLKLIAQEKEPVGCIMSCAQWRPYNV